MVRTVCVLSGLCLGLAAAAPAQAQFGAGVAGGLLAERDEVANAILLGRVLDGRVDDDFAGGFLLGRALSPVERNLLGARRVLARQRLRDLERDLDLARARQRRREIDRELAIERELLRRDLQSRGVRQRGARGPCN